MWGESPHLSAEHEGEERQQLARVVLHGGAREQDALRLWWADMATSSVHRGGQCEGGASGLSESRGLCRLCACVDERASSGSV